MADFLRTNQNRNEVTIIQLPGVIRSDWCYGIYMSTQAYEDGIIRIKQAGEDKVLIHPDGRIEVCQ
jgi:hypothetical protein